MSGEKTEQPTARKLRKFREEGRVAKSQELGGMLVLYSGVYLLAVNGPAIAASLGQVMRRSYASLYAVGPETLTFTYLREIVSQPALGLGLALLPWLGALMLVGVGANIAQTRGLVQPRLLIPKWDRLNPINRAKQMYGKQMFVEAAKGIAKQLLIALVVYFTLSGRLGELLASAATGLGPGIASLSDVTYKMALDAALVLLAVAVLDYIWQFHQHRQSLLMSKQEVRDESKQQDGSPEVKSRIRRIQREMSQRRMMAKVPQADAVIVNPTHFAVAIRYDSQKMAAPRIVAKGQDELAFRIISLARRHGVVVVPNKPLARALFKLPLDAQIPPEFFQAVAEVLAFVYSLRKPKATAQPLQGTAQ